MVPTSAARTATAGEPLHALQRTAGNRAVTLLIQRYIGPTRVEYSPGSAEGDAAFDHRVLTGTMDARPNIGMLWEGGQRVDARISAGDQLHAEQLLLGGRVVGPGPVPPAGPNFAAYKNPVRPAAKLYTERAPCGGCRPVLDAALRADDEVLYSVPAGTSEQMTAALAQLIRRAQEFKQDEEVARGMHG